jgi:hypothetical protein
LQRKPPAREPCAKRRRNALDTCGLARLRNSLDRDHRNRSRKDPETTAAVSRAAQALGRWVCYLSNDDKPAADRVLDAMVAAGQDGTIPLGWLPSGPDDPILVDMFRRHWPEAE